MDVRLRVVEFGGVWHWYVTADSSLPIGNDRRFLRLVAQVLHAIEAGVFPPDPRLDEPLGLLRA